MRATTFKQAFSFECLISRLQDFKASALVLWLNIFAVMYSTLENTLVETTDILFYSITFGYSTFPSSDGVTGMTRRWAPRLLMAHDEEHHLKDFEQFT